MDDLRRPEATLDELGSRACGGDGAAEAALFADLRVRFLTIAKRRVRPEHVEDVVQDTLGIVLAKYGDRPAAAGLLVWSLTVLRNVVGNHYQALRRDSARTTQVEDWQTVPDRALRIDPVEAAERDPSVDRLEGAIRLLARRHPRCGTIFTRILESLAKGGGQRDVSRRAYELVRRSEPDLTRNGFYVALHRCRAQLRTLVTKLETEAGHV